MTTTEDEPPPPTEPLPYYRWFVLDYRADVRVQMMTPLERGLYRELLDEQWREGSLPNEIDELALAARCSVAEMEACWPRIRTKFTQREDGRWVNAKLERMRTESDAMRVQQSAKARLGGKAKAAKAAASMPAVADSVPAGRLPADTSVPTAAQQSIAKQSRETAEQEHSFALVSPAPGEDLPAKPYRESIEAYWVHRNPDPLTWSGSESKHLRDFLDANPSITVERFRELLNNRNRSQSVNHGERPRKWIASLLDYANGPLDRFNRPLRTQREPEHPPPPIVHPQGTGGIPLSELHAQLRRMAQEGGAK